MNLLVCSQYFWPENFPINDVVKALLEKGIKVEVLTGKPNYPRGDIFPGYCAWGMQQEVHQGVNVYRIPLMARKKGGARLVLNYLSFVISGMLFAPWVLRKKRYDAIFVYAPSPILQALPALLLGAFNHCPVVLWVQDLWPESLSATGYVRNRAVLKLVEWVVRFIYKQTDLILVQSPAFEEAVRKLAPNAAIVYYPNSVDDAFAKLSQDLPPLVPGLDIVFPVLFAGNIGSAQAVEVIVEAATILKDVKQISFVVLGDGSRREWMRHEVKQRGLCNLYLPGSFPVETMPGLMQRAAALLVTLADQEIFRATIPSKVQAYLAAGRPILACLNGVGAELVNDAKAGISVPAENGVALATAVLELYHMPKKELEEMGMRGRSYYQKHFSQEILMNKLVEHLQSVCDKKVK